MMIVCTQPAMKPHARTSHTYPTHRTATCSPRDGTERHEALAAEPHRRDPRTRHTPSDATRCRPERPEGPGNGPCPGEPRSRASLPDSQLAVPSEHQVLHQIGLVQRMQSVRQYLERLATEMTQAFHL